MEKPYILHLFTPAAQASPFDVNMALDAGYQHVLPYTGVDLDGVRALTQDAIFSRGPKGVRRTGIFIGGRDMELALDMLHAARASMVPPFEVSVFADPSGAFTTAAALVAAVERRMAKSQLGELAERRVLVFGGTGPVGATAAVLAASGGARVCLASSSSLQRAQDIASRLSERCGVALDTALVDAKSLPRLLESAEIVLCAAKAGVEVLSDAALAQAPALLIAADVNAVPPAGISGVGVMDDGAPLAAAASGKALGIGALAIGNIKYQVEKQLFEAMRVAERALYLDFRDAFAKAREVAAGGG